MTKSVILTSVVALSGLLAAVSPALAVEVTFNTTGIFSTTGTNVLPGAKGGVLTFTGNPAGDDVPSAPGGPPADATVDSLGTFTVALPKGASITGKGTFLLTINQTSPAGTANFGASALSGTLTNVPGNKTGSVILTFAKTTVTISGITYTLEDLGQNGLAANQLAIGKNGAELNAAITSPLPEPTFFGLTGLGFFGLAAVAMRRYKQRQNVTTL